MRDEANASSAPDVARIVWHDTLDQIGPGKRAYRQITSLRTGRRFRTFDPTDRVLVELLDCDADVEDFRLRSAVVHHWLAGVEHTAKPLLWLRRRSRNAPLLLDWRPTGSEDGALTPEQAALRVQLQAIGVDYQTASKADWLAPGRVELLGAIRRHAHHPVTPIDRERVRRAMKRHGHADWHAVLTGACPWLDPATACRLIFDGGLRLTPSDRPRPDTRVELAQPRSSKGE